MTGRQQFCGIFEKLLVLKPIIAVEYFLMPNHNLKICNLQSFD